MKKTFLNLMAMFAITSALFAQSIQQVSIIPPAPTSADTILIVADLLFLNTPCNVKFLNITQTGNTLVANTMHCFGWVVGPAFCFDKDTFKINPLPAGDYVFVVQLFVGQLDSSMTNCLVIVPAADEDTVNFSVLPMGINGFNPKDKCVLFPNPFNDYSIIRIEDTQLLPSELKVYDVLGQEAKGISILNIETKITKDNLSSGLYYYRLLQKGQIIDAGKMLLE